MIRQRKIKLVMLALFVSLSAILLISNNRTAQQVHANTVLAESHTGSPGEPDTCATSGCHSATLNSGQGTLKLQICPSGPYEPGVTYTLTVSQSNLVTVRERWGFQLTALRTAGNEIVMAGDLTPTDTLTKRVDSSNSKILGRQYIEHQVNNNIDGTFRGQRSAKWSFTWTAPSSDVGPVTFYVAGAQCDNNETASGDEIYTTTVTLNPKSIGNPVVNDATANVNKLNVSGSGFAPGALIFVDDKKQKTTFSSDTKLVGKKAGLKVKPNSLIRVVNTDNTQSNEFRFGNQGFTCPPDQTISVAAGQTTVTLNYTVPSSPADNCNSTVTCTPPPGTQLAVGTTRRVDCVTSGGRSCSFLVTVGSGDCRIICPPSFSDSADAGQNSKAITYPNPTTTGNCGAVTCTPPSGSTFPVNMTTPVTCRDTNNNSCMFTVTLNPPAACQVICPNTFTLTGGAQVVNYPPPTTSGNCGAVTCMPPSGSTFQVGPTPVRCSEPGGANCSFNINISAPTPCTLTCPGNITQVAPAGQNSTTVNYTQPTTSGPCGTVTCSPPSGSVFPVGPNPVTCTSSAGSGSCGFTITVSPSAQSCVVTCPANVSVTIPAGQTSTPVTYPAPTVTGNCGTVTCAPPSGESFAVGTTMVNCTSSATGNGCSFTVTVTATPLPCQLTCPANIEVTIPQGQLPPIPVTYPLPTTSGNCGTVMCAPPSGSPFPVGTMTVNCTASTGGSCSFTVTVIQPPCQLTCPPDKTVTISLPTPTPVPYDNPTAMGLCGTVVCDPPSGSTFPVGTTGVTCTARVGENTVGSCSFKIIVIVGSASIGKASEKLAEWQIGAGTRRATQLRFRQPSTGISAIAIRRIGATANQLSVITPTERLLERFLWRTSLLFANAGQRLGGFPGG